MKYEALAIEILELLGVRVGVDVNEHAPKKLSEVIEKHISKSDFEPIVNKGVTPADALLADRLLYVAYSYQVVNGSGYGYILLRRDAPKTNEEIQLIVDEIKTTEKVRSAILLNWFYLTSK